MSERNVVVLGASGMLGSMVVSELGAHHGINLTGTTREPPSASLRSMSPRASWAILDVAVSGAAEIQRVLTGADWAINAIGILKPYIQEDDPKTVERAIQINALFPHRLALAAERTGCRVIQIATDCVYSGKQGQYQEPDVHDAIDVYGKTKSLGEVPSPIFHLLRCSIIGPEPRAHVSLLDWFLEQAPGASLRGFTNHLWNGVTTLQYARICRGIIEQAQAQAPDLPHVHHLVPTGAISKLEMLQCFAREYGREDLTIASHEAPVVVDRTLQTSNDGFNRQLWYWAGYQEPPTVPAMIAELAELARRTRSAVGAS